MRDEHQTKNQLLSRLSSLRERLAELERREAELRRTMHATRKINAQLAAIAKAFDGTVSVCSRDYRIEYMDERLIKRIGYDGTGKLCYKVFHDRDSACPWCVNELVFNGETVRFDTKIPKSNRWYHFINVPVCYEDGTISKLTMTFDINDRKNADEKLLRTSEDKYRELVENAGSIILRMDERGKITFFNEFAESFFGYQKEEILGRNAVGTIIPEVESTGRDLKSMIEDIGRNPHFQINCINENVRRNGERVWIAWTNKPIRDVTGNATEIWCIGNDVTERKRAEDSLRESEERFRRFAVELSFDGIVFHHDGIILDVNETFAAMFGYTRAELVGMDVLALIMEESRTVAQAHWRGNQDTTFQVEALKKEGTPFPIEVLSKAIPCGGKLVTVATARDITERKHTEEALKAAHRQFMDIIEFLPDATFVIDRKGKVIAWNRAIEELTGLVKRDILGRGEYAYAVPFYGKPRPMLIDLVFNPRSEHFEDYHFIEWHPKALYAETPVSNIRKSKEAFLWGTASPLYDGNGNLIGSIESIRDITERKEIESALRQREKTLESKRLELEETNTALKVLLRRMENDREELEESITSNMKEMILPSIEKLRNSRLDENQRICLASLESHLNDVLSPFLKNLSARLTHLTPMEIQVASLVKEGKTSKEISQLLGIAEKTVSGHRYNLRMKLGLKNEKLNLRSHLLSLK